MVGEEVDLLACQHSGEEMSPYERLLSDAIRGDPSLFAGMDSVEAAWCIVDPILGNVTSVYEYEPNTWGPTEADRITPQSPRCFMIFCRPHILGRVFSRLL